MEIKKALEMITLLSDGIDPQTGEVFPEESTYQNPETVRALFIAVKGLEKLEISEKRQKRLPENAGKGWDEEEEELLIEAFDNGKTIKELAELHKRTNSSIKARLIKLEKIAQ
ncbi:hypothetical protein CR194_05450 [Salipaludibacillus keqinensis]|uniref:Uncharacterized protein n=1 Tax=Salipaludibacillus keqinensis TaxID=2045207 RepID=A0A323TIL3_9BACI|nr:hypothetical protein [Salipaludibacillus keqinensis]PYZ94962.1 hypothetical protein CR194_05450 [Salipaludibacillus keqinensis]